MNPRVRRYALLLALTAAIALSQVEHHPEPKRLPNGKDQQEEVLKAEHEQNRKDAARLVELAEELKQDIEKNDRHLLSIATLKKTDEIEKLVRRIRGRMRR